MWRIGVHWLIVSLALGVVQTNKNKPDFSGTWKCVNSPKQSAYDGSLLVIVHNEPKIKMSRKITLNGQEQLFDLTFFSDERTEINLAVLNLPQDANNKTGPGSVTRWDGRRLVTTYSIPTNYRERPGAG